MFSFSINMVLVLLAFESGQCRIVSNVVYSYLTENATPFSPVLQRLIKDSLAMPMGGMTSSHTTTALLMNLLRIIRGRNVLDIGTYGGLSAIAMATVLPADGKVVTIDITDRFWNMTGRNYVHQANVIQKIDTRFGRPAALVLSDLIQQKQNSTFDLCYVDADKFNYKVYFEQCYQLVRPLGLMAFDNVLWSSYVASNDTKIQRHPLVDNFRKFNKKLAQDPRIWSQVLAVGDGLALAVKKP